MTDRNPTPPDPDTAPDTGPEVATGTEGARARFDKMYHEIRSRIILLDYPPGTRLSEEAMAREFGVSRTPLRRVLGRLEGEGLLQSVHGVGTLVTDVEVEAMAQVYRLRMELAEIAGHIDAVPPSPELLAEFEAIALRSRALVAAPEARAFSQLNIDFFEAQMALTGNEPLRDFTRRLYYQTSRIWLKSVSARRIDLIEEVRIFDREIEDFVRALRIGDLSAAAHVRRAHISMSFTRMRQNTG